MRYSLRKEQTNQRYNKEWVPIKADLVRIETIVRLAGRGRRILDVGCYDGHIGKLLLNNGNEVYGVDFSQGAVSLASAKGIRAIMADIEEDSLPFEKGFFDCIIAAEIIEHIIDTDSFLEKLKALLVDKGDLIITTPNLATLGRRLMLLCGKNPLIEVSCQGEAAGHIRYFVKESLFDLLDKHGLEIDGFFSDGINFDSKGKLFLRWPARILPSFGKTLIVKAKKRSIL